MKKLLLLSLILLASAFADETKIKTLVIVSHPYPEHSTFIKGLEQAARSVKGVEVRNLEQIYGYDTRAIDGDRELKSRANIKESSFCFPRIGLISRR